MRVGWAREGWDEETKWTWGVVLTWAYDCTCISSEPPSKIKQRVINTPHVLDVHKHALAVFYLKEHSSHQVELRLISLLTKGTKTSAHRRFEKVQIGWRTLLFDRRDLTVCSQPRAFPRNWSWRKTLLPCNVPKLKKSTLDPGVFWYISAISLDTASAGFE